MAGISRAERTKLRRCDKDLMNKLGVTFWGKVVVSMGHQKLYFWGKLMVQNSILLFGARWWSAWVNNRMLLFGTRWSSAWVTKNFTFGASWWSRNAILLFGTRWSSEWVNNRMLLAFRPKTYFLRLVIICLPYLQYFTIM